MIKQYHLERSFKAALFLCLIFIAASGCTRPEQEIGRELQPSDELFNVFMTDTSTVILRTEVQDTLVTHNQQLALLGMVGDLEYGRSEANIYSQLVIPSDASYDFWKNPANIDLVDVTLFIKYSPTIIGEKDHYRVAVYELTEEILSTADTSYTNESSVATNTTSIVELPDHVISVNPGRTDLGINLDEAQAMMVIPLGSEFGNKILAADSIDTTADGFKEYIKGIKVQLKNGPLMVVADMLHPEAGILLNYTELIEGVSEAKSAVFTFNNAQRFNERIHSYDASPLAGVEADGLDASELGYMVGGVGTRLAASFPFLKTLDPEGDITVNKAELIIEVDPQNGLNSIPIASSHLVSTLNADGATVGIIDYQLTPNFVNAVLDPDGQSYRINITRHIQSLLNGTADTNLIYVRPLAPIFNSTKVYGPLSTSGRKSRLELTFSN